MKYLTLDKLVTHPKNVRAQTEYAEDSIAALARSIDAVGLLQGLVVQQLDDGAFGVLAGRRRMLALKALEENGALAADFKAPCKVVAKDVSHLTALSLAENELHEPMSPIDEYDAYAAMTAEGQTVAQIAGVMGATERHVMERLRFGLVHPDIRAAARSGAISLDVLKAYASHPCTETQLRLFQGLTEQPGAHNSWTVRERLRDMDLRADDPLARFVLAEYEAAGGEIVRGLFEEDTVLKDRALAERLRDDRLRAAAEAERERHGFKWADALPRYDFDALAGYGRVYPKPRDLTEADEERLNAIAERLDAIWETLERAEEEGEIDEKREEELQTLEDERDRIEAEADAIQQGYLPEEAAIAGVIAVFRQGTVTFEAGLVRPEDMPKETGTGTDETDVCGEEVTGTDDGRIAVITVAPPRRLAAQGEPAPKPAFSESHLSDLAVERSLAIAAAVVEDPGLAYDIAVFRIVTGVFGTFPEGHALSFSARPAQRAHSRPEAIDPDYTSRIDTAREALDLGFLDAGLDGAEKFRAFRELDADMKAAILASAIAATVEPTRNRGQARQGFEDALAAEAVPDLRAVWTPTAANFWSRVTRPFMLERLEAFGMTAEAEEHRTAKKATLADFMEKLFAAPFATLSAEQVEKIEHWAPATMLTNEAPEEPEEEQCEAA